VREDSLGASIALVEALVGMPWRISVEGDRWGGPSRFPPSLFAEIVCAFLPENWHSVGVLRAAELSNAWIAHATSLLGGLIGGGMLSAEEAL